MGNMSYCRFENTLRDLRDCNRNLDSQVSESEHKARKELLELCGSMLGEVGIDVDGDIVEAAEKLANDGDEEEEEDDEEEEEG